MYSEGSAPIGATRPLLSIRTALRSPTRSPIEPTAAGSPFDGTPRQTRSMPGELDLGGPLDGQALGQADAVEVALV